MSFSKEAALALFEQTQEDIPTLVKTGKDWNGTDVAAGDLIFVADDDPEQMWDLDEEAYVVGFYEVPPQNGGGFRAIVLFEGADPSSIDAGIIERAEVQV